MQFPILLVVTSELMLTSNGNNLEPANKEFTVLKSLPVVVMTVLDNKVGQIQSNGQPV